MNENTGKRNAALSYMGIGFEFMGIIFITTFLGFGADSYFKTGPWLMLAGLFIGFFYGVYYLYKRSMQLAEELKDAYKEKKVIHRSIKDRADSVDKGMNDVGRKINDIEKKYETKDRIE